MSKTKAISYASTGVDYGALDPVKKMAQKAGIDTSENLKKFAMKEVSASRGETAFVWENKDYYLAHVLECLGSKNLVADEVRKITGKTHYDAIGQDTVASAVNDIVAVGAQPMVVNAYFSLGDTGWLNDNQRIKDLISGWQTACNLAGATWGGGETPTIKGVTYPNAINLAASCVGIIQPKSRLTLGNKLKVGDKILFVESNGIHANGISLARAVSSKLPQGYATKLENGQSFGEALLKPTHIYARVVNDLFAGGVDIHYLVNVTGHSFRKIMRASGNFSYIIDNLPSPQPEFDLIKQYSQNSDEQMYGNFNMGVGLAVILPEEDVVKAQRIANENNFKTWLGGYLQAGPKKVVIKPKNIVFAGESLGVR